MFGFSRLQNNVDVGPFMPIVVLRRILHRVFCIKSSCAIISSNDRNKYMPMQTHSYRQTNRSIELLAAAKKRNLFCVTNPDVTNMHHLHTLLLVANNQLIGVYKTNKKLKRITINSHNGALFSNFY